MSKQKENLEKHVQDKQIGESNYSRSKQNKVRETIKLPNYKRELEKYKRKTSKLWFVLNNGKLNPTVNKRNFYLNSLLL